jgi:hypothetical protein
MSEPRRHPAALVPCQACPWRLANQGRRHPGGWYTAANLRRLWAGLRRGEDMSCHPTDPANPVPDGWRQVPPDTRTRECAGALILKQREVMVLQEVYGSDPRAYRRGRPHGLTSQGVLAVVERAIFGGGPIGGIVMTRPNLNEPGIGYPPLGPWKEPA